MNWDQIETKWAAMTRRVRADWPIERPDPSSKASRGPARGEVSQGVLADLTSGRAEITRQKTANE
ncbi:MAG: hypothetical protein V4753_00365 [Pseudomonadota bacterium]